MMKWVVRGVLAVVSLVVLGIIGIVIFLSTLDPNDYKVQISKAVQQTTGRDLTIVGNIGVSVYPVLGFKTTGVTMSNPSGFLKDEPFLSLESVSVGVQILPLLNRQVRLTTIILDRPQIYVIKTKQGKTNLDFSGGGKAQSSEDKNAQTEKPKQKESAGENLDIQVGQIKITNAVVTYDDRAAGTVTKIDPLNVTIPGFSNGKFGRVTAEMTAQMNGMTVRTNLAGSSQLSPDYQKITISDVDVDINAKGGSVVGELRATAQVDGSVDIKAQKIDMILSDVTAHYADTDMTGKAAIKGPFAAPLVEFSVVAPRVNMGKMSKGADGVQTSGDGQSRENLMSSASKTTHGKNKLLFPVEMLRTLNMKGDVQIGDMTASGLKFENIVTKILARQGVVDIAPLTADFYDGAIKSKIRLNASSSVPTVTVQADISRIHLGDVISTKMGDDYVSGVADATLNLRMSGNHMEALANSASGTVRIDVQKGEIRKWKLSQLINQAIAIYKTRTIAPLGSNQFDFSGVKATFLGSNGVFRNDDFVLNGPKMHAFGNGVIDIGAGHVDYTVLVGDGTPDRTAKHIPLKITGPLTAPSYGLDAESFLTDLIKDKIEKKLKNKLLDKLGPIGIPGMDGAQNDNAGAEAPPTSAEDVGKQLLRGLLQ